MQCSSSSLINFRPFKIPLSAFVVQDMMEFVQAHASYRFVIKDEEEEKPRILVRLSLSRTLSSMLINADGKIWLFKPKIRLAYTTTRHHVISNSANVLAAKVLFKLLRPNERQVDIKR